MSRWIKWAAPPLIALSGCSTSNHTYPNQKLVIDGEVSAMSRQEVINAIHDCQTNDLRPVIITSKKKVEGRITDIVTDVTCFPYKRNIVFQEKT